jgi:hypothetical protein
VTYDPEPTLANFATRDPTLAIKQHVSFNKEERTFTCLTTEQTCTVLRAKTSGTLLKVHCNLCKQTFSYSQIPVDWRAVSLWCKDPKFLPEEARASYTPPPVGIHTQGGVGGSNAAAATEGTDFNNMDEVPTLEEARNHLHGNGVIPNKPHVTLPINRLAWARVLDDVSRNGHSRWEHRLESIFFGREPEHIDQEKRRLEEYRNLWRLTPATSKESPPTPARERESTPAPHAHSDGITFGTPVSSGAYEAGSRSTPIEVEEVVMQPADHISVPPVVLSKGKARAQSASTSTTPDIASLVEQFESLKMTVAAALDTPEPKVENEDEMAELRMELAKLTKRLDQQDEEMKSVKAENTRLQESVTRAAGQSASASKLITNCVSLEVANNFQKQINDIVNLLNTVPAQIEEAESRVGTLLQGLSTTPGPAPITNLPEGLATKVELNQLKVQVEAYVEVHNKNYADTNLHVENFHDQFRELPNFEAMRNDIDMASALAKDAKAKANAIDQQLTDIHADQMWQDIRTKTTEIDSLTSRVADAERQSEANKTAITDLVTLTRLLQKSDGWHVHDFNFLWAHVQECMECLYPKFKGPKPVVRPESTPLRLYSTMYSLRPLRTNETANLLPNKMTNIFNEMRRSKLAREQAAAQAANAQGAHQTQQESAGPSMDPAPGAAAASQPMPSVTLRPEPLSQAGHTTGGIRSWVGALRNPFRVSPDALPTEQVDHEASMSRDPTSQFASPLDTPLGDDSSVSTEGGDEAPSAPTAEP